MALTYVDAGVDQTKKDKAIDRILEMMRRTHDKGVIDLPWGFAGLYSLVRSPLFKKPLKHPVLVACTDGVGTKLKLARSLGIHDTVGIDLVAMSVNDLIVTGASPLFFLDYIAMGKVDQGVLLDLVKGIVDGCAQSECALLGGETAEMPGMYQDGDYDVAGFCVGIVDKANIIDGSKVKAGDSVIALPSSGLHSNGYSLARKIVANQDLSAPFGGSTLGRTLLTPTRIYARTIRRVLEKHVPKAMANITGGGMTENIPRVIPKGLAVEIHERTWKVPPVFEFLRKAGEVPRDEMYRVFNMGVGMVLVVAPAAEGAVLRTLQKAGEKPAVIGKVVRGRGEVR
ncbi:MAG TPA: phosphoribosylformylglycinamidine cyclo-ligase, partial [Planctomycetota bacterium]|nr:phosphoribosylformylglycinamidine cyclo-ligase [Planctomycetota bacterium]